jgi:hypothetical protein
VLGTHPGTGKPYSWHGGEPGDVARADLPELTEAVAREFVTKAADIMRAQQGWTEEVRETNNAQHAVGDSSDEFDSIYGNRQRKYALAALQGCTAELSAMAPDSGRNDKLNAVAFRLGTMCAVGSTETRLKAGSLRQPSRAGWWPTTAKLPRVPRWRPAWAAEN